MTLAASLTQGYSFGHHYEKSTPTALRRLITNKLPGGDEEYSPLKVFAREENVFSSRDPKVVLAEKHERRQVGSCAEKCTDQALSSAGELGNQCSRFDSGTDSASKLALNLSLADSQKSRILLGCKGAVHLLGYAILELNVGCMGLTMRY
jgi:hypothetical protein